MRVNIDEIKEGGLQRAWDLPRESVDEFVQGDRAGYRARSPLHVESKLRRVQARVIFDAKARAELNAPCGKCLSQIPVDVPLDFEITFVPEGHDPAEAQNVHPQHDTGRVAGSFDDGDVNEDTYSGKVLDLDPVIREQLLLALPAYPVCQEACKGLCSVCGANLNERECSCDRHVPDPRWAGLEKLREKKKT
jgi:uncharacterized protein